MITAACVRVSAACSAVATRSDEHALAAPALANLRIGIIVLPAGDGRPAALAVKVSTLTEQNSLWRAQLGTLDYWNIFWPGEGSVFASGYSNYWPLMQDGFLAMFPGGGEASEPGLSAIHACPCGTADRRQWRGRALCRVHRRDPREPAACHFR